MKRLGSIGVSNHDHRRVIIESRLPGHFALTIARKGQVENGGTMLYSSTNLQANQVFFLIPHDKYCYIQSAETGRLLEVGESQKEKGVELIREGREPQVYSPLDTHMVWRIIEKNQGSGQFYIMNAKSSKVFDVCEGKAANYTPILQYGIHDQTNQIWTFKVV